MNGAPRSFEQRDAQRGWLLDAPTLMIAIGFLLAGYAYAQSAERPVRLARGLGGSVETALEPGFIALGEENVLLLKRGAEDEHAILRIQRLDDEVEMSDLRERREMMGVAYRELEHEETRSFGGHHAEWSHYAIVVETTEQGAPPEVPMVLHGVDVLVDTDDGSYHVDVETGRESPHQPALQAMLNALVLR